MTILRALTRNVSVAGVMLGLAGCGGGGDAGRAAPDRPVMPDVSTSTEMAAWRSAQTRTGSYADIKFLIEPIEGLGVPAIRNEIEGAGLATVEIAVRGRLLDVTTGDLNHSKALAPKAIARMP